MAYTPATLTLATWSTPLTIQATDLLTGLDDAVNAIVDTNAGSIKNHINTEMAKVPTYLSAELVKVNADVLTTVSGYVTSASGYATAANNSAISAAASAALAATFDPDNYYPKSSSYSASELDTALGGKQATLVSGTNIKTINRISLVGSGDVTVDSLPTQTGNSGKFLTTNGTDASWGAVEAQRIGIESIFDTVLDLDLTTYFPTSCSYNVTQVFPFYESGDDYKYLIVLSTGTPYYILPVQRIAGVVTVGTAVLYNAGANAPSMMNLMSGNRVLLARNSYVGVLDCSTFLAPTFGAETALTVGTTTMYALDGTRAILTMGTSTPSTLVCAIDIGASGTTITKGADVTLLASYNSAGNVKYFDNTNADKADILLLTATGVYSAVQIKAIGTVVTVSGLSTGSTGTCNDTNVGFVETAGTVLVPAFTTTTAYMNKVVFDQTSILAVPTLSLATGALCLPSQTLNNIFTIKTKVANVYLVFGANNTTLLHDAVAVYGIYNSSTNTFTNGTSYNGLYLHVTNAFYLDISTKTTNQIALTGARSDFALLLTISPTTGDITAVKRYVSQNAPQTYQTSGMTIGENHYIAQTVSSGQSLLMNLASGTLKSTATHSIVNTNGVYTLGNYATLTQSTLIGGEFYTAVGGYAGLVALPYFPYGKAKQANGSRLVIRQPKAVL